MPIILDGNLGAGYMGAGASLAGQRNATQNENMQRAFQTGIGLYQSQMEREDRKKQLAQQQENWDKYFNFNKDQADQQEAWKTYKATQDELERNRLIRRDESDRGYLATMLGKPELAKSDVSPNILLQQVEQTARENGIYDTYVKKAMFDQAQQRQQDEKAANGVAGMVSSMAETGLVQPEEADAIFKLLRDNPEQAQNVANGVQQRFQVQWAKQRQKQERAEQAGSMRSFMQTATWMDPTKRKRLEMMADGVEAGIFTPDDFAREMAGTNNGNSFSLDRIDAMEKAGALSPEGAEKSRASGGDLVITRGEVRNSQKPPTLPKYDPTMDAEYQQADADRQATNKAYQTAQASEVATPEQKTAAREAHAQAVKQAATIKSRNTRRYYIQQAGQVFQQRNGRAPSESDRAEIIKIAQELEAKR